MNYKIIKKIKLNIKKKLFEKIEQIEELEGSAIVGSFTEKGKLDFNDIDVIIIVKKLDKKIFKKCIRNLKEIKPADLKIRNIKKIKINSTFGPLKFNSSNTLVIHAMIYDIEGHIDHVKKSPFTCMDWERSKIYLKKHLKDIFDVKQLSFADFFQSRRSINDYLKDLSKNIISYRKYQFFKNKYKIIKKTKKINNKNKIIFYNHIVKNLICNYFKFFYQKNIKFNHLSKKNIIKAFGKDFFNQNYKNIIKLDIVYKKKKLNNFNIWNFIKNYHKFLKEIKKNSSTIVLIRHKKTKFKKSIFISNKINPSILEKKKRNSLKKVDYIFSSPMKRCLETAKQYFKSDYKITIDNNLREINYGKAEGLDLKQIKNKFPEIILSWRRGYDPRFPGGENTKDVFNRVKNFNRKIFKIDNKKIGVVSHNNFIRCFIGLVFKLNLNKLYKIYVPYFNKISFIIIQNRILLNTNRTNIYRILKKY